jgi:hypothetical protein
MRLYGAYGTGFRKGGRCSSCGARCLDKHVPAAAALQVPGCEVELLQAKVGIDLDHAERGGAHACMHVCMHAAAATATTTAILDCSTLAYLMILALLSVGTPQGYYRRYRICVKHCNLPSIKLDDVFVRFCQQVASLQRGHMG